MLAAAISLVSGVILPLADSGRQTGSNACETVKQAGSSVVDILK